MNYPRLIEPAVTAFAEPDGTGQPHPGAPGLIGKALSLPSRLRQFLGDWLDRLPTGDGNLWSLDDIDRIEGRSRTDIARTSRDAGAEADDDRLPHWSLYCLL